MLDKFKNGKLAKKALLVVLVVYLLLLMGYLAKDVLDSPSKSILGLAIGGVLYFVYTHRKKRAEKKLASETMSSDLKKSKEQK
nr:hypothetical protein BdHM001_35040 [Bdellovibrio sp. HM001]